MCSSDLNQDTRIVVTELHRDLTAIDVDAIILIDDLTNARLGTVNLHLARRDHRLHIAPRTEALLRKNFVQPFAVAFTGIIHAGNRGLVRRRCCRNRQAFGIKTRRGVFARMALADTHRMRLFTAITLIAIAPPNAIHRTTGVTECAGVGIVFRTIFAFNKRCTFSGERGIVGYECAVGGCAVLSRIAWTLAFASLAIATVAAVTSATATAIATRAAGTILLLAVRAYRVRVYDDATVCAHGGTGFARCAAVGV